MAGVDHRQGAVIRCTLVEAQIILGLKQLCRNGFLVFGVSWAQGPQVGFPEGSFTRGENSSDAARASRNA